jgi:thiol-disulfide isomerase/thioredoxin
MKQLQTFTCLFALPMCLVLAAVLWAGGCIQPVSPVAPLPDNGCARPKVLVFSASWCGPCQRDKAVLVQVKAMGVEVQVIDIDARPDLARKFGVTSVPTYFIYVCGRSTQRTNDISVVVNIMRPLFRR